MKALTVLEPWATAIIRLGKTVENRTWWTGYRGPLLIHAGKSDRCLYAGLSFLAMARIAIAKTDLRPGHILGVVDLVDCLNANSIKGRACLSGNRRWADTPDPAPDHPTYYWVLANPQPIADTIPYRGAQGLWPVPEEIRAWLKREGIKA